MQDSEIIALYWQRDESAVTVTAEQYGSYCKTIAYNILQSKEDAEECVNDTWLAAWQSIPPKHPERLGAYLGKLTRNIAINRYHQANTQKRGMGQTPLALGELDECIPAQNNVEQAYDEKLLVDAINRFLRAQPVQKRNIFIRRYWYLCPIGEIAAHYSMSESKVTSLLFRMRKALRSQLAKEDIAL